MSELQAAVVLHGRWAVKEERRLPKTQKDQEVKKSADLDWRVNAAKPVLEVWTFWRSALADKREGYLPLRCLAEPP